MLNDRFSSLIGIMLSSQFFNLGLTFVLPILMVVFRRYVSLIYRYTTLPSLRIFSNIFHNNRRFFLKYSLIFYQTNVLCIYCRDSRTGKHHIQQNNRNYIDLVNIDITCDSYSQFALSFSPMLSKKSNESTIIYK